MHPHQHNKPTMPWRLGTLTPFLFIILTFTFTMTLTTASASSLLPGEAGYSVQCGECDPSRCPQLRYCEGKSVKDSCNCCTVCSSPKYQPHVAPVREDKCSKVQCSKFEVCVANMQGLPLCKCPSEFLCRSNRKRKICGTDGQTYESKCHMRIASCNQKMMIRRKHRGICTPQDVQDGELYKRKMRRRMRRKERRRQRMEMQRAAAAAQAEIEAAGGEVERGGGHIDSPSPSSNDVSDGGPIGEAVVEFGAGRGAFNDETLLRGIGHRGAGGAIGQHEGGGSDVDGNGGNRGGKASSSSKRKRGRRKKRKQQRKLRKRAKKEKKERRKRRRKRQHRPKSRSKRHRLLHPRRSRYDTDAAVRQFQAAFGVNTWTA